MAMKPDPEGDQAGEKENEEDQLKTEADGEEDEPPSIYVNNERGEDYQDQIGMPDEENMRNWSHHYSTDTVDDPVFRAAMRGYDAVSFVFGLEVTWSLIQERQQEEEEKQALLELEAMQEMNGALEGVESEDESDSDDDDKKMPAKGKCHVHDCHDCLTKFSRSTSLILLLTLVQQAKKQKKASKKEESDDESSDEDDSGDEEEKKVMQDFIVEEDGDENGDYNEDEEDEEEEQNDEDEEEQNDGEEENEQEEEATMEEESEQEEEEEQVAETEIETMDEEEPAPIPKAEAPALEELDSSDAKMDDVTEPAAKTEGESVDTEMGDQPPVDNVAAAAPAEASASASEATDSNEWRCSSCTFANQSTDKKCAMCDAKNPRPARKPRRRRS